MCCGVFEFNLEILSRHQAIGVGHDSERKWSRLAIYGWLYTMMT